MNHEGSASDQIAVAGIVYDGKFDVDAVLSAAVDLLRSNGLSVGGLLQHFGETLSNGKRAMYVEDLSNGERIRLDIPRGKEASGCTLDPDGLNRAACALKNAIAQRPDVLLINRFGKIFNVSRLGPNTFNFYKKASSHEPNRGLRSPVTRECNVPNMNVLFLCSRQRGSHGF